MLYCSAKQIGIAVHDDWLFRNISLEVHEHDRLAIIGPNGSGKTTMLRLLSRTIQPDEGQVALKRDLRVGNLEQLPVYSCDATCREILFGAFDQVMALEDKLRRLESRMASETSEDDLTMVLHQYAETQQQFEQLGGYVIDSSIRTVMNGLKIPEAFMMKTVSSLSGGEQTKVFFARMLLQPSDLLLLDEPTNHLDLGAIEWLEGFLMDYSGAVVMVSHDRTFLDHAATHVLELDSGEAVLFQGGYTAAIQQREERLLQEFQAYQEQQKKIERMLAAIKRLRDWANRSNPPSAGLHRRATNMERILERMEKLKRPALERRRMELSFDVDERSGKDVVSVIEVVKQFDTRPILNNCSLHVRYGERVAIVGDNGSGKSTLLNIILGHIQPDSGTAQLGQSVHIGYLQQQGLFGFEDDTVIDAFRDCVPVTEGHARNILARFLFYGESVFKKVKSLSGGEQMRLRMAQLMYQGVNLLVLDEPTNHLDIESREVVEEALKEFTGTVIAVSHDRHFLNHLFQRVLWLENGSLTEYLGTYDEARRQR